MQKMKCNYRGLVDLFGRHLYPEPDLCIRELLQNAHDAILLRRVSKPAHAGRIHVTIRPENGTLTVSDDGEGLSPAMIDEYLSTVGSSGTAAIKTVLTRLGNTDVATVGRFGIGFLSAFTAGERVDVFTRHMESGEAWRWTSRGEGEYTLLPTLEMPHTGTRVMVTLNAGSSQLLDETFVERAIRTHADYLPIPIFLNGRGPVNAMRFPWEATAALSSAQRNERLADFVERRYREFPLLIIPVDLPKLQTHGCLFIADPRAREIPPDSQVDLYQDRMFLRSRVSDLLPEWAWLRGIVNTRALQPNAARDDAHRNETWHALRQALGETVADTIRRESQEYPVFRQDCADAIHSGSTQFKNIFQRLRSLPFVC